MKKIYALILSLTIMLVSVSGCGKVDIITTASPEEIVLLLDISEISEPVYAAEIEYSLNGKAVGDYGCCNANGSALRKYVRFALTEDELPENTAAENLSFNVMLYGDKDSVNGESSSSDKIKKTGESKTFDPSYGRIYRFTLSGSFEDGFKLSGSEK